MTTNEWFMAMGDAVKERNRALAMVENWQEKVRSAEARISELAAEQQAQATTEQVPTEQAQEQ